MTFHIKVKHGWNGLRFYISFLLLAFYLVVGFLFLFTDMWIDLIPQGRLLIGILLMLFGAVRFYIAYRRYKKKQVVIDALRKEKKLREETKNVKNFNS
jgi:hypothetical protein